MTRRRTWAEWEQYVRETVPDLVEAWPDAVLMLTVHAQFLAAGQWEVTQQLLRDFYDRRWREHVEAVEAGA